MLMVILASWWTRLRRKERDQ